jgi:hypothetical protein
MLAALLTACARAAPLPPPVATAAVSHAPAVHDEASWGLILDDVADAWADIPSGTPCFALAIDTHVGADATVWPETASPRRPAIRFLMDGAPVRPTWVAPHPMLVGIAPVAPGVHEVLVELETGNHAAAMRRAFVLHGAPGRGTVLRVLVAGEGPDGEPPRLDAEMRDVARTRTADGGQGTVATIAAAGREVETSLAWSRKRGDLLWILCLEDRLRRIHAIGRAAAEGQASLANALAAGDESAAAKARARLLFSRRTALELLEAAHHCV